MTEHADKTWPWPDSLDALIAAPKHHKLVLDNERVRVLDTHIPAGDFVPVHTHRWPGVYYTISGAHFVRRDEKGNVLLDTRIHPMPVGEPARFRFAGADGERLECRGGGSLRRQ